MVDQAFQSFPDPQDPIKTKQLKSEVTVLEMFYGKSLAYKDFSMCCTYQLIQYFLRKHNKTMTAVIGNYLNPSNILHAL